VPTPAPPAAAAPAKTPVAAAPPANPNDPLAYYHTRLPAVSDQQLLREARKVMERPITFAGARPAGPAAPGRSLLAIPTAAGPARPAAAETAAPPAEQVAATPEPPPAVQAGGPAAPPAKGRS